MNSTPAPLKKDEEILSSKYEMKINDEKYLLHLISNSLELNIKIEKKNSISSCFYQNSFNSEQLKKLSKSFTFYDSIKDIYFCIKTILDRGNGKLIKENENIIFSIPIFLPTGNQEIIKFNMKKQQLEKDEIIQGLYSRINDLENIIVTLKENEKNKDILINNIKKRLDILKKKKKKNQLGFKDINESSICKNNEISLFINEFQNHKKFKNKTIGFKLLYKASKDSDKIDVFHNKCDYKDSVLIFIKPTNGKRFGGYTEIGFNSKDGDKYDDNAFVFSLDKMKIYNIKKGNFAIYCQSDLYGFKNTIYLYNNSFTIKNNRNIGGCENYPCEQFELNGEDFFLVSEIEVYQVVGY